MKKLHRLLVMAVALFSLTVTAFSQQKNAVMVTDFRGKSIEIPGRNESGDPSQPLAHGLAPGVTIRSRH
ncbi:hypothetical protein [Desulfobacula phenolica]|uniref:hypothetical protein n=1 Tax=Desulfobacula phenolica TaxID=90732 RepID=UPI0011133609|nr:hypothetical protein [Desulfobacula phenolica]